MLDKAFIVKINLSIFLVDQVDFRNLLVLKHFLQLPLIDFLLFNRVFPADKLQTNQRGEQNGIDPHEVESSLAIGVLLWLLGLTRLVRDIAFPVSLFFFHL